MNKLITFFCVVFFLIETSDSFAQQIKSIIVSKDNKIDQRDYLQNQENCIYLCSINELNSFKETLESNLKSDQNIFLIQLNDISTFSIHNTDLVNAIVFKLPYELSSSIIQRWIPVGWSINKVENSTDFIYAVQRSANGQCSKEEKILLFQEMFLKSLDLIEKSKNSNEYTLYLNQQLSNENSKNYNLIVSLTQRIDSLQNAFIAFNESEKSIEKKNPKTQKLPFHRQANPAV